MNQMTENPSNSGQLAALAVHYVSTAQLVPYARNARMHSEEQIAQIAGSIAEFGFVNPILVDKHHGIIAGHGGAWVLVSLGWIAPNIMLWICGTLGLFIGAKLAWHSWCRKRNSLSHKKKGAL